jgi:hypothetical protein
MEFDGEKIGYPWQERKYEAGEKICNMLLKRNEDESYYFLFSRWR